MRSVLDHHDQARVTPGCRTRPDGSPAPPWHPPARRNTARPRAATAPPRGSIYDHRVPSRNGVSKTRTEADTGRSPHPLPDAPLSSAQKSLLLVEALADAGRPLGVSELAQRVNGSRGTVHKQLAGLVTSGWVEQGQDGRYGLTLKLTRLGNAALQQAGLGQRIHTFLEQIAARAHETVSVAALADDAAVIIQRAECRQALYADIRVGTRMALDASSSGLVLAAFALNKAERDALRSRGIALASESKLARVRQAGFVYTADKVTPGISAVSMPLYDSLRFHTVSLNIAGPTDRLDPAAAEPVLREGRDLIVRAISGDPTGAWSATAFPPSG
ncbi:IclR family transcriptional regulator [Mycobacterium sp. pUA109]|uniref:IclR family transcriptional regulator n=1 Tax=Mycobacterium sp. pUA109 TaxID=3238982 RepID=UPI00351AD8BD